MRVFWGIIAVLLLASAGFIAGKWNDRKPMPAEPALVAAPPSQPAAVDVQADSPAGPVPTVTPDAGLARELDAPAEAPTDTPAEQEHELAALSLDEILGVEPSESRDEPIADVTPAPEVDAVVPPTPDPASAEAIEAAPTVADAPAPAPPPAAAPAGNEPAPAVPAEVAPGPKVPTFGGYELIPVAKTVKDDGSLLLDDRFVISGKGTEAEPYKVTWELLLSASETLAPRQGKKKLPERLTMLDGQWVELTGYIAFPLMVQEADELLLMLNQWDGCCIGVPPTPYDAIEVALDKPAKGQDRFAVQGAIKGKLGVKPHLVGEWLVGIYVMDSATLSTKAIGGVSQ
jgi:hypothetical protein